MGAANAGSILPPLRSTVSSAGTVTDLSRGQKTLLGLHAGSTRETVASAALRSFGAGTAVTTDVPQLAYHQSLSASAAMAAAHATLIRSAQALISGTGAALRYFPETDRHFDEILAALPSGTRRPLPKK